MEAVAVPLPPFRNTGLPLPLFSPGPLREAPGVAEPPPDKAQNTSASFPMPFLAPRSGERWAGSAGPSVSLIMWRSPCPGCARHRRTQRLQRLLEGPVSLFIQTTLWIKQSQLNVKPNLSLDADNHFNNISPFVPKHQGNKAFLLSGSVRLQLV